MVESAMAWKNKNFDGRNSFQSATINAFMDSLMAWDACGSGLDCGMVELTFLLSSATPPREIENEIFKLIF